MRTLVWIILIVISLASEVLSQNKRDYHWIMGLGYSSVNIHNNYQFDFNESPFVVDSVEAILSFDHQNTSMSSLDGELLFYSNGCAVANREHEIMPNGIDINAGDFFDTWWEGDCDNGYPGSQDILSLPDPYNDEGYYLISKPRFIVEGVSFIRDFQYSYIDMSLDGGLGDVTIKNEVVYDAENIQSSYLQAVKHLNGIDWWVIQPSDESNRYLLFLIDESGLHFHHAQEIGPEFHENASAGGKAKFSPDGTQFAYYNPSEQLLLFDFDRETGLLSNVQVEEIEDAEVFSSIEYSASGQFLYFSLQTHLYQLDVFNLDDPDALVLIDEWNGVSNPLPNRFFLLQRGADCRIYMCPMSSTYTYNVINKPDLKGVACDFVQQGIEVPHVSGRASFPNFPNFRIDESEYCDPTISSLFGMPIEIVDGLTISPNPASDFISMGYSSKYKARELQLFDMQGNLLRKSDDVYDRLDVSELATGLYSIRLVLEDGRVLQERFVKI